MCEEFSYQIINTSSWYLPLLEVCKIHYRKENISVDGSKQGRCTLFLNLFKKDLAKRICITLGV